MTDRRHPDPMQIRTRQDFAAALTALREQAGETVRDVARSTGLSTSTVGDYFSGRHLPPLKPATALRDVLAACGLHDDEGVAGWEDALHRIRRTPGPRRSDSPEPYRGLSYFREEDAPWFFGRDDVTQQVIDQLATVSRNLTGAEAPFRPPRVVVVVGASGSGKSSLLRAGVLARLNDPDERVRVGIGGRRAILAPGRHPLTTLAAALPRRSPAAGEPDDDFGLFLLVIDQFEELFTACADPDERARFVAAVHELATTGRAVVLIGLRADFYRESIAHPRLRAPLEHAQVVLGAMDDAQLRSTIVEPAAGARGEIEEGLVDLLLRDLRPAVPGEGVFDEAGALPLLSHVLWTMWQSCRRSRLTVADYRATGGVHGAVAATAEQAITSLSPAEQDAARRLFLRLITVGDDTADTRRLVDPAELGHAVTPADADPTADPTAASSRVLDVFVAARLITVSDQGIEITHEALIAAWPRLRGWVDGDRAGLRVRRQITEAAQTWQSLGRDPSALFRGTRLEAITRWCDDSASQGELNAVEAEFVAAGIAQEAAESRQRERQTKRLRRLAGGLAVLLTLSAASTAWSVRLTAVRSHERDVALSRQVAAASNRVRATDTSLAAQLALTAYGRAQTAEARSAVLDTSATAVAQRFVGPRGVMQAVAVGEGGRLVVGGTESGVIRMWRRDGAGRVAALDRRNESGTVFAAALGHADRLLATAGAGGVQLWDLTAPTAPVLLPRLAQNPEGTVFGVALSTDGRFLAAAGVDRVLRLWDVSTPGQTARPPVHTLTTASSLHAVAFSPDGRSVAAGADDGTVLLWRSAGPGSAEAPAQALPTLRGPTAGILSLAFSPDGTRLAAGSRDKHAYVWNVPGASAPPEQTPAPVTFTGPTGWVNAVAFGPDGARLAAGSSDSLAWQWDLASRRVRSTYPHPGPVTGLQYVGTADLATAAADGVARLWPSSPPQIAVAGKHYNVVFSTDGRRLAVGAGANEAGLVDVTRPTRPVLAAPALIGPGGAAALDGAIALSADGAVLATGGVDGSILLWDVHDPAHPQAIGVPFDADGATVESLTFSPRGRLLAVAGDDAMIRLWDIADPLHPRRVGTPLRPGGIVFSAVFSPDGHRLAAGTSSHVVMQWDLTDPEHPRPLGPAISEAESYVFSLVYSPDGRLLAAGSADRSVWVWDVADAAHPRRRTRLTDPTNYVYGIAFSPDGATLAAGSADGMLRLWSVPREADKPYTALATLSAGGSEVLGAAFSPDGRTLVGSTDTGVTFWRTDPDGAAAAVCSAAGATLTPQEWQLYLPDTSYRSPCPQS